MKIFKLPDLGEGLQDAEIIEWHVAAGDEVTVDQPLLSVETAKAIVEIPSPRSGRIQELFAGIGEIVPVGGPLAGFSGDEDEQDDTGTVVGRVETARRVDDGKPAAARRPTVGINAVPAVRALAKKLGVDLSIVTATGPNETISTADVQRVARILAEVGPLEPLRGVRRVMAGSMAQAHAEVARVMVCDDVNIRSWHDRDDITLRLVQAIAAACKAEPSLNAWYDHRSVGRRVLEKIHLAIAVDTPDGLFVPVLHDVANRDLEDLRKGFERLKQDVRQRTIPPEEMRGYTFTLSNFGAFGGRYADPIVVPPTVAILGAGRVRDEVVPIDGQPVICPILPLSLSIDHRAVTGGEATRFLAEVMRSLQQTDKHQQISSSKKCP